MFNAEKPSLEDLPSSAQLLRSTILAAVGAVIVLVVIVLPAEYGIDPTGIGRTLGLTEMGEIKTELAIEAEKDHSSLPESERSPGLLSGLAGLFVGTAQAQSADGWKDEVSFALQPGQTFEVKLTMNEGDVARYLMTVDGGRVNFDLHAHGQGQSVTYEKGRGSTGSQGELVAAFAGNHGWFWRNRDKADVTVMLQLRGDYSAIVREE